MIKYRADRFDGTEKIEGFYQSYNGCHYIKNINREMRFGCGIEINPLTLEIFLFGEWRLVSELEKDYRLCRVFPMIRNYDSVTITSMPQPKRKPIDGVLPLTKEEFDELGEKFINDKKYTIENVYIDVNYYIRLTAKYHNITIQPILEYRAILWLANLFDLEG